MPKPCCKKCGGQVQGWGYYRRTDVRDGDGVKFEPIPIRRFYCRQCNHTFSAPPTFLCRYLHYVANVVDQVFSDWLAGYPIEELPLQMDGPALLTVRRWIQRLNCHRVQTWLEQHAPTTPSLEIKNLGRRVWTLAQSITKATRSHALPAALIQWAKLRHLLRYGSSTYNHI